MALEIRTTWAKIGIQTTRPFLEMRQPQGELQIKQQRIKMVVDRELPRVLIDQSACFQECGLKPPSVVAAEAAQLARQKALEYMAIMAAEGDRLGQIENAGEDAIGELSLESMERENSTEWNIAFIPQSRPQYEVTGHLKIDWQVLEGGIKYQQQHPQFKFRPWTTEIYLRQHGEIKIRYLDERV